jgi:hypothetical protein
MRTVASTRRPYDPLATARFMLLCAGFLVGCGLINMFVLTASSTWLYVLSFGGAAFCLLTAAELKWVWPRLMARASRRDTEPG